MKDTQREAVEDVLDVFETDHTPTIAAEYDRLVARFGQQAASRLWSEACELFDERHAAEAHDEGDYRGVAVDMTLRTRGRTYRSSAECIDEDHVIHDTIVSAAGRLAYRAIMWPNIESDDPGDDTVVLRAGDRNLIASGLSLLLSQARQPGGREYVADPDEVQALRDRIGGGSR